MADTRSRTQSVADSNGGPASALQDLEAHHRLPVSTPFAFVQLGVLTI
jgi:hypothetical protein